MVVFYAFCRTMDDLADDAGVPDDQRARSLDVWKNGLLHGFHAPDEFQQEVISLRDRREIPTDLLVAIIDGCRQNLADFKVPRAVYFVDEFPTATLDKVAEVETLDDLVTVVEQLRARKLKS